MLIVEILSAGNKTKHVSKVLVKIEAQGVEKRKLLVLLRHWLFLRC